MFRDDPFTRDRDHGARLPTRLSDASYERLADQLAKRGHPVWEIRPAEPDDGGNAVLVRKEEEREVSLRGARKRSCVRPGDRVAAVRRGQVESGVIHQILDTLGGVLSQMDLGQDDNLVVEIRFDDGMESVPSDLVLSDDDVAESDLHQDDDGAPHESDSPDGTDPEPKAQLHGDADHGLHQKEDAPPHVRGHEAHAGLMSDIRRQAHRLADAVEAALARGAAPGPCAGCPDQV